MKYHLIYKITNKINGKIYIGQKSYNDIPSMENYYGGGIIIKTAVKRYGRKNFTREILYSRIISQDTADAMEIWAIEKYKPEYNIAKGGKGKGLTDETKQKISKKVKNLWEDNGYREHQVNAHKNMSEEQKNSISSFQKTRFSSKEEKQRTSIATKEGMSKPEIRAKVSDGLKKYYAEHPENKPISTLGKKWYNNGIISKFYFEGEQPDGWTLGRIKGRSK